MSICHACWKEISISPAYMMIFFVQDVTKSREAPKRTEKNTRKVKQAPVMSVKARRKQGMNKKKTNPKKCVEQPFKNIYFHQSKKFRPAKSGNDEFQFDFSLFDSNDPSYPRALDDINFKLLHTNSFWKNVKLS